MTTQDIQVTLRGQTFKDIIAQANALVLMGQGFAPNETTPVLTLTETKTPKVKAKGKTVATALQTTGPTASISNGAYVEDEDQMAFDLEMETDEAVEETEVDEKLPTPKAAKAKKLTDKDVNAAAIAYAKVNGREKTLQVLTKKFKVKSVLELKPDQYEAVIKALEV